MQIQFVESLKIWVLNIELKVNSNCLTILSKILNPKKYDNISESV